jgi:deoxyribodipyrimidine photolyase
MLEAWMIEELNKLNKELEEAIQQPRLHIEDLFERIDKIVEETDNAETTTVPTSIRS